MTLAYDRKDKNGTKDPSKGYGKGRDAKGACSKEHDEEMIQGSLSYLGFRLDLNISAFLLAWEIHTTCSSILFLRQSSLI
jgi:hypothetical protein